MTKLTWISALAIVLAVGCGGETDENNGSNNGNNGASNNGASNNGASNNGASNNGGGGSGDFIEASGTYNGTAFTVDCDLDHETYSKLTSGEYRGHEQCPAGSFQIQCRVPEMGFAGTTGQLAVDVRIWGSEDNYTIQLGDTLGQPLDNVNSANAGAHTLSLDSFTAGESAAGSFSATWTDDGSGQSGEVTGTFNATCDG